MISRLGLAISAVFRRIVPDPFVIAVLLTFLTAALALIWGFPAAGAESRLPLPERITRLADGWTTGFWDLLKFAMQMCLILVTGHALAASRPVAAALRALSGVPRTGAQAAALVAFVACLAGVVNWGLGLIVGAVLARDVGRSAAERGIPIHYPVLAAAGYMGLLVFHGGLSGSAPLAMSTIANAKAVLRPEHVELLGGKAIELDRTLGSTLNLVVTGGMVLGLPLLFVLLMPKRPTDCRAIDAFPAGAFQPREHPGSDEPGGWLPDWLDRTRLIPLLLAALLLGAVGRFVATQGLGKFGFDQINAAMFALGLIAHGSTRSYLSALEDAATGCAGIIVQFPIYAGIMAMMSASGLTKMFAQGITSAATSDTLPVLTFVAATIVGLFVPSGGAQWSIQGPIALESAANHGVDFGPMVMAVGYGDELANMLQPFWALPLLAITGVKARDIVGYTALAMVAAGAWMALGLIVFS